ncbi:MAG: acetylgalactosaminidase [Marinilabiliales bacterium]|nr:MAG: acetylgalactosaminidase [Marinilabiliales bacterium]
MATDRRTFLRLSAIGAGAFFLPRGVYAGQEDEHVTSRLKMQQQYETSAPTFNMSGYRAPKIPVVRVGFLGLGDRGGGAVIRFTYIEGVEIKALNDKREAAVKGSQDALKEAGLPAADEYFGEEDSWKAVCERDDIDLIYICSNWAKHTPMALYAMEHGKHVAVEVPAAVTLDEAWQLVEMSEKTKKHCMMLENCCYDFFELLTLNMARQGYFGDLVHAEGAYIHCLMELNFNKPEDDKQYDAGYTDMWRLKQNTRNGNLYPTHGLGPVCQIMNINRGDKMDYLTSMSSADFGMAKKANELAEKDDFYKEFAGKEYRGNMNTSLVKTNKGRTIMIQHDVTSLRPYSRIHMVMGQDNMARKWPYPPKISDGHRWVDEERMKELEEKYTYEIVKKIGDMAKKVGGHGGMDFLMDWRLIDCLRNGLPMDQDVYDAALWSAISPLSEWSVANRSNSVDVPDFTRGNWKNNAPVDLNKMGKDVTGVRDVSKADSDKQLDVH